MWTVEESNEIQQIAKDVKPDLITHAIPPGLREQRGMAGLNEYLKELIPKLLD